MGGPGEHDQRAPPLGRLDLPDLPDRHRRAGPRYTVVDDGVGAVAAPTSRRGGLEELRERLAAGDGELAVTRQGSGFRLVATVPGEGR